MKELECLKDLYLKEIDKINKKGDLTPADAEAAKKALEALDMIEDLCDRYCDDDGYSERSYPRYSSNRYSMRHGYSRMPDMRYDYDDRYSSRRGMRYSRHSEGAVNRMLHKLEDMRLDAPDEETRMAIDNVITKLETY